MKCLLLPTIFVFPANFRLPTRPLLLLKWFGRGSLARARKCYDLIELNWLWSNGSFKGPQIRLLLNSATYPLTICEKSLKDRRHGTCSLDEFVKANSYSMNIRFHDKTWNASCEFWVIRGCILYIPCACTLYLVASITLVWEYWPLRGKLTRHCLTFYEFWYTREAPSLYLMATGLPLRSGRLGSAVWRRQEPCLISVPRGHSSCQPPLCRTLQLSPVSSVKTFMSN